jgi:predicted aspartyl protease
MVRLPMLLICALAAWVARAPADTPVPIAPAPSAAQSAPPPAHSAALDAAAVPATSEAEITPADTKPDDFIYVAATSQDRIGRVMLPVYVNDVGPFAFLVDTGATSSVLAPRLAARLKILPDASSTRLLRGITGSEVVPTVHVDKITAGGITLSGRKLPVVEPRVFADADGIFGADAFAGGCLHIAFAEARVSILQRACPRSRDFWETMPATFKFGGLPIVTARVGGVSVAAIIDTGAERSLGNRALVEALKLQNEAADPARRIQVYAATSQPVFGHVITAPTLRMRGIEVANLSVVFGPFEVFRMWEVEDEPALLVGMDVLGSTNGMMIDFQRNQVKLLPRIGAGMVIVEQGKTGTRVRQ